MEKGFCIGMILGLAVGSIAIANCKKARQMIIDGQNKILDKLEMAKSGQSNCQESNQG